MEKSYELCVLFSGTHTPAEIDELAKQVDELLAAAKAEVKLTHSLGRRKLAYKIKNNTHGEYRLWLFSADGRVIPNLNEKLRLNQTIVRHLITAVSRAVLEKRIQKIKEPAATPPLASGGAELTPPEPVKPKEKEKLSLEELDKKLDEILESDNI